MHTSDSNTRPRIAASMPYVVLPANLLSRPRHQDSWPLCYRSPLTQEHHSCSTAAPLLLPRLSTRPRPATQTPTQRLQLMSPSRHRWPNRKATALCVSCRPANQHGHPCTRKGPTHPSIYAQLRCRWNTVVSQSHRPLRLPLLKGDLTSTLPQGSAQLLDNRHLAQAHTDLVIPLGLPLEAM